LPANTLGLGNGTVILSTGLQQCKPLRINTECRQTYVPRTIWFGNHIILSVIPEPFGSGIQIDDLSLIREFT